METLKALAERSYGGPIQPIVTPGREPVSLKQLADRNSLRILPALPKPMDRAAIGKVIREHGLDGSPDHLGAHQPRRSARQGLAGILVSAEDRSAQEGVVRRGAVRPDSPSPARHHPARRLHGGCQRAKPRRAGRAVAGARLAARHDFLLRVRRDLPARRQHLDHGPEQGPGRGDHARVPAEGRQLGRCRPRRHGRPACQRSFAHPGGRRRNRGLRCCGWRSTTSGAAICR